MCVERSFLYSGLDKAESLMRLGNRVSTDFSAFLCGRDFSECVEIVRIWSDAQFYGLAKIGGTVINADTVYLLTAKLSSFIQ